MTPWRVTGELSAPQAALAAAELREARVAGDDRETEIALSHGDGPGEGFRRRAEGSRVQLRGDSPNGLLFGAYATLEELAARWPWPGAPGERPSRTHLAAEVGEAPALEGRCLILGERALVDDAEAWIVWGARHRLNGLFVHVSMRRDASSAAPEAAWLERRDRAVALARERGMAIEHGGHLLPELLSRADVRDLAAGRVRDSARTALRDYARDHPEADVLHLWGADRPPGTGGREASEAALRTANAVAEVVEEVRPDANVAFLAYHDTEEVPRGVRPRRNVCLVYAPRERCYEHSIADLQCAHNARFRDLLVRQVEHFRSAGAPAPRVFEYWFDAILFARGVPDLSSIMGEDLAFYRDAGVHTVQILMTGHGRAPPPHPNPVAFARLAWDPARPALR